MMNNNMMMGGGGGQANQQQQQGNNNIALLEARIESAIREAGPSGLQQQQLEAFREPMAEVNQAVQRLVKSRRVDLRRDGQSIVLYMPTNSGGLSEGCAFVLEEIKNSAGEGVELATVVSRTKMVRMEVNKALKILIEKKLIEETRSFANKAKKVYIQAGVALSNNVTGGVFYAASDNGKNRSIDTGFVDSIRAEIMNFVSHYKVVSTVQIKQHFDRKSLPKALNQKDINMVTHTLQLDGFIEMVSPLEVDNAAIALKVPSPPRGGGVAAGGDLASLAIASSSSTFAPELFYKIADNINHSILKASVLDSVATVTTQMPCMGCPLLSQCSASGLGPVNPTTCVYLDDWLRLEPK